MKKVLDSDWPGAVQFKCNTSANYTPLFWIMIGWKTIWTFLSQWYHVKWWRKFCAETLKKVFANWKKGFKENLPALPPRKCFMFILLISNRVVCLVQFGINLHLWVNTKLNSKPYDYLHKQNQLSRNDFFPAWEIYKWWHTIRPY